MCVIALVIFFKKKTAYEMRISDWSSDVCSSDLRNREQSRYNPLDIGVNHHRPLSKGDGGDGGSGIGANARKLQQLRFTLRKATTIFPRHHSGAGEQVARPRIIAKARPCGHQISLIGGSQGGYVRPPSGEDRKSTRLNSSH